MRMAGGLTPECCMKAVSFVCMCDGFGVPLLVLQDTPGFLVSAQAERDRAIDRVMTLLQAMSLLTVPAVSVVIRKAFGLAFVILDGNRAVDLSLAWPSISRSFAATGQFDWRGERVDGSISVTLFGSHGRFRTEALSTGDVGIGNPFLGGGGPRGIQLAIKLNF